MRASEFLIESKSADLYHGTDLQSAEAILRTDRLGDPGGGNQYRTNGVCLSREFQVACGAGFGSPATVVFVLDQLKLSQVLGKHLRPVSGSGYEEREERSDRSISPLSKFIKNIIVLNTSKPYRKGDFPLLFSNPKTIVKRKKSDSIRSNAVRLDPDWEDDDGNHFVAHSNSDMRLSPRQFWHKHEKDIKR